MEQPFSTSKVKVEYFDPHDVYKLLAPGLVPRLPLHSLHWQSHAGPLRSIETLHVELVDALAAIKAPRPRQLSATPSIGAGGDDGFQTQSLAGVGKRPDADAQEPFPSKPFSPGYGPSAANARRHQIPGLRQTPYLKVFLIRCDDNDQYKSSVRAEVRDWVKEHVMSPSSNSGKKGTRNAADNHDACEWLIIHVVVPNTVAATQPRVTGSAAGKGMDGSSDSLPIAKAATSRWGKSSSPLLEKLRSDLAGPTKGSMDRIAQIRIGINDVPYDLLPRVVPAVPTGYMETEEDAKVAWADLIDKFKRLILSSFDMRVSQYEDDIKEKDAQRTLPGWNFCTFFMLKEGLARGFESVGLVEDALVGYDELSVGLDMVIQEQAVAGSAEIHGASLLPYTADLQKMALKAVSVASTGSLEFADEETVDLELKEPGHTETSIDDIPISVLKKSYRELILANNVSIFDFRCYIFARQIGLLLRLGNSWSTREELLAKLKEQQESVLHGVAPRAPPPQQTDESENLSMLAEICKRTLEFIPAVSQVMRRDVIAALTEQRKLQTSGGMSGILTPDDALVAEVAENIVASFAFSIAQQILAQTSTKVLSVPPVTMAPASGGDSSGGEQMFKDPTREPTTMLDRTGRRSVLRVSTAGTSRLPPLPSPNFFPGPGSHRERTADAQEGASQQYQKAGQEELAARRAELYALSRNILEECGKKRGWSDGWSCAPMIGEIGLQDMQDVSLDGDDKNSTPTPAAEAEFREDEPTGIAVHTLAGVDNKLLRTAMENREDFYCLYEMLTNKSLRHYTAANHTRSVLANMADLAVMKYYLEDYAAAASYFLQTTPFYGESGWSLVELSMLVMYSRCLRNLERNDDYIRVVLKLLSKAANAEKGRIRERRGGGWTSLGGQDAKQYAEFKAFRGFLPDFLAAASAFKKEVKHSLENFFTDIELEGIPVYDDGQDSFSLTLKLRSVLADALPVEKAMIRMVTADRRGEMWLQSSDESMMMSPGRNKIQLKCNSMSPGTYEVDRIRLISRALELGLERQAFQPVVEGNAVNLRHPHVVLYQRTETFDVQVEPSTVVQLDQKLAMDLELSTGWNKVKECEVRIRSATGGLRLLTAEARIRIPGEEQEQRPISPETGLFLFSSLAAASSAKIRIPFMTEDEVVRVSVKVEARYTTEHGNFKLFKTPSISLALELGVNVQDVFKHTNLLSRFTVSTATQSPIRLFRSELVDSDVFESGFGTPPANPVMIFPKQPASLIYKIQRKCGSKTGPNMRGTMYLKLFYSVLHDEMRYNVRDSLTAALKATILWEYSRLLVTKVLDQMRSDLSANDLEVAATLGEFPVGFLGRIKWHKQFYGLGSTPTGQDVGRALTEFMQNWAQVTTKLPAMRQVESYQQRFILIPVEIPSIAVVHTAEIRLQRPLRSLVQAVDEDEVPVVCVNQLLPATLHLKWTRVWDTKRHETDRVISDKVAGDEFAYAVSAPSDTWLVGGRKKGHFVIPSRPVRSNVEAVKAEMGSRAINEADIPLLLIPLREGYLQYPRVEVRDAGAESEGHESASVGHCETDYKNMWETIRVIADRGRVTVSLDASGPGGGPLVLESERSVERQARRVVA